MTIARFAIALAALLDGAFASSAALAQCTVPNVLTNGEVADASEVMDNFNAVADCADAAAAALDEAVKPSGMPAAGEIAVFSGEKSITGGNLSGDVSTAGGTVTTLAPTGVTPGSYASANLTVDAKGRITSVADGTGPSSNRYAHIRLFVSPASTVFNVNNTAYVRVIPLSFATDFTHFPWTHFQIAVSGNSNQSGQPVSVELHSVGVGDPLAGSANNLVVNSAFSLYRSAWIARTDGKSGQQEYTLFLKGSNATVDLNAVYIDILLRIG